ncbi:alcohol dehydrogenase catalytic domain-containing protein [Neosynechococcus sphagnicola]|uniref:alcohol dehydrogenase catalytic domain-containing protein n=1 Tax=Neosynechococcus sphagnicola TaxID=1501145 RepID=UPI000B26AE57|nr:alcohol dehydrogenase catalytic domain-containing protein [Neosynechococcus sphagnicola]
MLAALLYGSEDLRLETVPDPTPAPGEVVIQVTTATTCGTDLKVWRRGGHAKMLKPPTLFGHEAVGRIVALGAGVTDWRVGDRVVANNSAPCLRWFFLPASGVFPLYAPMFQQWHLCRILENSSGDRGPKSAAHSPRVTR